MVVTIYIVITLDELDCGPDTRAAVIRAASCPPCSEHFYKCEHGVLMRLRVLFIALYAHLMCIGVYVVYKGMDCLWVAGNQADDEEHGRPGTRERPSTTIPRMEVAPFKDEAQRQQALALISE